ncbi:MAG: MBL fold metallo-hydrolase [Rhodospirillaceae bacterium]|nr:MBL fold metallo-hydrolase [Rhodospirillaceae bacterium]
MSIKVKIWGCRGSIACPGPKHLKYGGNTTSLEIMVNGETFILDCGTGIRGLGQKILSENHQKKFTVLLTHTHWDHINGFPFFAPAFNKEYQFDIMAGHLSDCGGVKKIFELQMTDPTFPVPLAAMQAQITFRDFRAGDQLNISRKLSTKITTAALNHPNGATGYRFDSEGSSVCLITDTEHIPSKPDDNILSLIEGADLVFYDSTYTEDEFPSKIGWGHSTWEEGVKLCKMAGVKQLGIFHHDPDHDDDFMDIIDAEAAKKWSGCMVAREGMELTI